MKNLTLTLLLLCSLYSFAQTGFIEVEVTDTVWMKPVSFDYNVVIKEDPYAAVAAYDEDEEETEKIEEDDAAQKLQTLKAFLGKKGYTTKALESDEFNLFGIGRNANGVTVTVKTTEQLEKLKEEVKGLDYAEGRMGQVGYGDKSAYDSRIYKKLIDGARKKGQVIAGYSGQKLGKITEVKEPSSAGGGMESYMKEFTKIFEAMGKLKKGDDNKLYGELSKTILVRFAAK